MVAKREHIAFVVPRQWHCFDSIAQQSYARPSLFFLTMASVRVGAFKVRTTEQISRRQIGGYLKERLNGGQLKIFNNLSRGVRAVDGGASLYVETADDLNDAGREELSALLATLGEVMAVRDEDAVRSREIGAQYRTAREREAAGIVLGKEAASIAARLLQFRGEGGPLKKRRKFGDALASTICLLYTSPSPRD